METAAPVLDHFLTAEAIAKNVDLLIEILLRVPAKSLVRFKCVSKDWLSFISDSEFSNNHMRKNLNMSFSGLYLDSRPLINLDTNSPNDLPKLDFHTTSSQEKITVFHSCNGLILCSRGKEIIVCNLTSQKFTVVPSPPKPSGRSNDDKFLVINHMRLPHYKAVFVNISSFYSYEIDIYSSENGSWNKKHFSKPRSDPLTHKVLCDGAIYWIADGNNLVFFDIDKENLIAIQMPPEPVIFGNHFVSWFGEHAGNLFLTQTIRTKGTDQLRVLEMDMHNYSWSIKYNINLEPIKDIYGKSVYVLCFKGGDGKATIGNETLALLLVIDGKIVSYNPLSDYLEVLQDLPSEFHSTFLCFGTMGIRVHKFIESLSTT